MRKLHVEGRYIKDDLGGTIYLRGVHKHGMEDGPFGHWTDKYGTVYFHTWNPTIVVDNLGAMRSWGCNVVRVFDCAKNWIENTSNHRQIIKDLLAMANQRGLYVVLAFYNVVPEVSPEPIPYPPYSSPQAQAVITSEQDFIDMWVSIATELKDYPNILFELWNEPRGDAIAKASFFSVAQQCVNAVRAITDHTIIVQWGDTPWCNLYKDPTTGESTVWGGGVTLQEWLAEYSLTGTNLVYSTHIYRMYDGTGIKIDEGREQGWTYNEVKAALEGEKVKWVVETWGKPLFIGECGCNIWAISDPALWAKESEAYRNIFKILNEWNISYCGLWWWPSGPWRLLNPGANYPASESGQILIQKIAEGAVPAPTPIPPIKPLIVNIGGPVLTGLLLWSLSRYG